jgi:hypothetical protein
MIDHIICTICGEEKSKDQFYKKGSRPCKPCCKKIREENKRVAELEFGLENISITNGCKTKLHITDILFDHPGFRLIFIDDNGNMSLEGPFDEESRKNVQEYRCISHLWGTADKTKDYAWKDHKIAGVTWKVEVREEKRERLLQIFNHHKGYFWMDVFCTNQEDDNKPLDVMGDIYKNGFECICLLDCPANTLEELTSKNLAKICVDIKNKHIYGSDGYTSYCADYSTRPEILDNWYSVYFNYDGYFDGNISPPNNGLQNICDESFIGNLETLFLSQWFMRIWTLQESVLPPIVLLTHETMKFTKYVNLQPLLDIMRELKDYFCRDSYAKEYYERREIQKSEGYYPHTVPYISGTIPLFRDENKYLDENFKELYRSIENIIKLKNNPNMEDKIGAITGLVRKCIFPCDYFHGISGLIDMKFNANLGVRGLFYSFIDNLAGLEFGWEMPNWTREHELYKHIVCKNMKIVEDVEFENGAVIAKICRIFGESSDCIYGARLEHNGLNATCAKMGYTSACGCYSRTKQGRKSAKKSVLVEKINNTMKAGVDGIKLISLLLELAGHKIENLCNMMRAQRELEEYPYIYIINSKTVIFSKEHIGTKFSLRDVAVKRRVDSKLVKNCKIIGVVKSSCRCNEGIALRQREKQREKRR